MSYSEADFIAWCADPRAAELPVPPGDDAAVLEDGTVVCLDSIVEGRHFESGTPLDLVARKALGACVSDVCAMGGVASAVLVGAQIPPGRDGRDLAAGLRRWAAAFEVALVGGDTVSAPAGALALAVAALGRCAGAPWTRAGARPGDRLWLSGPVGGSRAGRHLRVRPRRDVVDAMRAAGIPVHAAIDLSDGLGLDLPRMCAASGVGARVQADAVPVHADVTVEGSGRLAAALADGEDFELLLALPPEVDPTASLADLVPIGEILAEPGVWLAGDDGRSPWPAHGDEHVF